MHRTAAGIDHSSPIHTKSTRTAMTTASWTKEHGRALSERRRRRGLTQETLAEAAQVTTRTVQFLERGEKQPRPSTLELLATALGCRADDLRSGQRLPSIAVLPFKNLSADQEQEYFCDGLAEELINALVHVEGLRVAARTSSFHFKDREQDLRAIGEALGVDTVLEGSVRTSADRLRVTAQMIRVEDGFHLWSERFDRQSGEVFAIQEEISAAIVDRLRIGLAIEERGQLARRHTEDLEAYHFYLKGCHYQHGRSAAGLKKAIQSYRQAIERDPLYARAHAGIAGCYTLLGAYGWRPCREVMPKARHATEEALKIDNRLVDALASRAYLRHRYDWDWTGAEKEFRRALDLAPGDTTARTWLSAGLGEMGRIDESLAEARHACDLEPLSANTNFYLGLALMYAHLFDDALQQLDELLELSPDNPYALVLIGNTWFAKGNWERSADAYRRLEQVTEDPSVAQCFMVSAYAESGKRQLALDLLDQVLAHSRDHYVSPCYLFVAYLGLGDAENTLEQARIARDGNESLCLSLGHAPLFDRYRDTPWFHEAVAMMGVWH
jgi:serine/threonine-protein kinase